MRRTIVSLMVIVMCAALLFGGEKEVAPLAESLRTAIAHQDFVRFVRCFAENTEALEHLKETRKSSGSITLEMVNKKFAKRHVRIYKSWEAILEKIEEGQIDAASLRVELAERKGERPELKEINSLRITMRDKNKKALVLGANDVARCGRGWLAHDSVSVEDE